MKKGIHLNIVFMPKKRLLKNLSKHSIPWHLCAFGRKMGGEGTRWGQESLMIHNYWRCKWSKSEGSGINSQAISIISNVPQMKQWYTDLRETNYAFRNDSISTEVLACGILDYFHRSKPIWEYDDCLLNAYFMTGASCSFFHVIFLSIFSFHMHFTK